MKPSVPDPWWDLPVGVSLSSVTVNVMWLSNLYVCFFAWRNNISAIWARLIIKYVFHTSTDSVDKYRSVSQSMSSANLKTSILSITTVLSWAWSMSSTTQRNQICHTTTAGWCRTWCMIVSSNVAKSSRNRPKSWFLVRQCHVQSHRRAGKPATWQKNAYRCVRLFDELSHVV